MFNNIPKRQKLIIYIIIVMAMTLYFLSAFIPKKGLLHYSNSLPALNEEAWIKIDYRVDTLQHKLFGHGGGYVCVATKIIKVEKNGEFEYPNPRLVSFYYFDTATPLISKIYIEKKGIYEGEINTNNSIGKVEVTLNDNSLLSNRALLSLIKSNYYCENKIPKTNDSLEMFKTLYSEVKNTKPKNTMEGFTKSDLLQAIEY